jgi:ABC-type uncharacterized transport system permease subunit
MAAIRCASKAALPGKSMQHLQLGTAVFLAVGALLVALCVFIIGVLLPWLQAGMDAESLPPSKLHCNKSTLLAACRPRHITGIHVVYHSVAGALS